jgi:outer membrane protein assembly factor BamB
LIIMDLFAVVPIFTSAATALLPTILAAVGSVVAIALKPRELWRLTYRRPFAVGGSVAATLFMIAVVFALSTAGKSRTAQAEPQVIASIDWAKIAEEIIAKQRAGAAPLALAGPSAIDKSSDTPATNSLALGRDFARCFYGGGPAPTQPALHWRFQPEDTMFLSSPLVAGGRVYAAGCQSDLGAYTGLITAIDFESGKPLWQVTQLEDDVLQPFFSSPALTADGKYLVIGQGLHTDSGSSLLCFEAATGTLHWRIRTTRHIESSPAIFGDLAVVGAGAIEDTAGNAVGDPGFVLAVRISDGKELWRQPVNDPESSPAIGSDGVVYIGSGNHGNAVVAIRSEDDQRLRDGKIERVAWRTPLTLPVTSAITLCGDLVVAGAGNGDFVRSNQNAKGTVVALESKTGAIRWQTPLDDAVLGVIAATGNMLFCPCRSGEVLALSADDGHVLWRTRLSGTAPVLSGVAVADKRLYAVSGDGYLAILGPEDGKLRSRTYLNDPAKPGSGLSISSATIIAGRIVVGSETGGLECFAGSEGTP